MEKKRGNPAWVKGVCQNPKGRPKVNESLGEVLLGHLERKAKKEGYAHWLDRVVELAWNDRVMMAAVLKKVIPDKTQADVNVKGNLIVEVVKFAAIENTE